MRTIDSANTARQETRETARQAIWVHIFTLLKELRQQKRLEATRKQSTSNARDVEM